MSQFRQPEFLTGPGDSGDFEPIHRVRCPIHGFVRYSANERKVIDDPLFRRLRHIRQLALTEYIYPGATHTRFAHSLGAMHLAASAFDSLASKHGELMEGMFSQVEGFHEHPMARARQVLRLAALLHDIGHAPFSHAAEKAIFRDKTTMHEGLTVQVVREESYLGGLIDQTFGPGTADWVALLIEGGRQVDGTKNPLPVQIDLLHDLVSGEMDADRSDYLLRDSYYCGVDYGRFDFKRLLDSMDVAESDEGGLEIVLLQEGLHAFEALILARYMMNTQVYYHKVRRIYDHYLEEYFRTRTDLTGSADEILGLNDVLVLGQMMADAQTGSDEPRIQWARRIIRRSHHRRVSDTGEDAKAEDVRRSKRLFADLQRDFPEVTDWYYDTCSPSIHKLEQPDDTAETGYGIIRLVAKDGRTRDAGKASQIFSTIPRTFQCHRIYADLDPDDSVLRNAIRQYVTGYPS